MLFLETAFYSLVLSWEFSLPWFPALSVPSLQLMNFARFFLPEPQSRNLLKAEGWGNCRDHGYFVISQESLFPIAWCPKFSELLCYILFPFFWLFLHKKIQALSLYFDQNQKSLIGFKRKTHLTSFKYNQM